MVKTHKSHGAFTAVGLSSSSRWEAKIPQLHKILKRVIKFYLSIYLVTTNFPPRWKER